MQKVRILYLRLLCRYKSHLYSPSYTRTVPRSAGHTLRPHRINTVLPEVSSLAPLVTGSFWHITGSPGGPLGPGLPRCPLWPCGPLGPVAPSLP